MKNCAAVLLLPPPATRPACVAASDHRMHLRNSVTADQCHRHATAKSAHDLQLLSRSPLLPPHQPRAAAGACCPLQALRLHYDHRAQR